MDAVDVAVAKAVLSRDGKSDGARVSGPYSQTLTAAHALQRARKQKPAAAAALERTRLVVPASNTWPRFFLVAGTSDRQATPTVRVLDSPSARAPYGLWAELQMLPGATLPTTAPAETGVEMLPATAGGLAMTPKAALARYADVLTRGNRSKYRSAFAADELRRQVLANTADVEKDLRKGRVATLKRTSTAVDGALRSVRTEDGGALVIGAITETSVITIRKGAGKVRAPADLAALTGKTTFTSRITRRTLQTVALVVPPAGKDGKAVAVAASRGELGATGS
jgi:hypothetical protein